MISGVARPLATNYCIVAILSRILLQKEKPLFATNYAIGVKPKLKIMKSLLR